MFKRSKSKSECFKPIYSEDDLFRKLTDARYKIKALEQEKRITASTFGLIRDQLLGRKTYYYVYDGELYVPISTTLVMEDGKHEKLEVTFRKA